MERQSLIWVRVFWASLFLVPYVYQISALCIMFISWIHIAYLTGAKLNLTGLCVSPGPLVDPPCRKGLQQLGEAVTDRVLIAIQGCLLVKELSYRLPCPAEMLIFFPFMISFTLQNFTRS